MSPDKSGDCFMGGGTLQVRRSSDDPLNRRAAFYVDRILNGAKPYIAGNRCIAASWTMCFRSVNSMGFGNGNIASARLATSAQLRWKSGLRLVATMPVDVFGHEVLGLANARRVAALNPANWPAPNCHALHETPLRIVVVDGIVLGRPVNRRCRDR
jgi:hypothetical protein